MDKDIYLRCRSKYGKYEYDKEFIKAWIEKTGEEYTYMLSDDESSCESYEKSFDEPLEDIIDKIDEHIEHDKHRSSELVHQILKSLPTCTNPKLRSIHLKSNHTPFVYEYVSSIYNIYECVIPISDNSLSNIVNYD